MKEHRVVVVVQAPDDMPPDRVPELINRMIDIGLSDACDTLEDPDLDHTDAADAVSLDIGSVFGEQYD